MQQSVKRAVSSFVSATVGGVVAVVVLGGSAAGAFSVPLNSVTSPKIVDGSILTADLANGAVTTGKIADGTVKTADLGLAVRNRLTTGIEIFEQSYDPGEGSGYSHSPDCDPGMRPLSGGGLVHDGSGDPLDGVHLVASYPREDEGDWLLLWRNDGGAELDPAEITGWVVCAPA